MKGHDAWLEKPYADAGELGDCHRCDNCGEVCDWCEAALVDCACPVIPAEEIEALGREPLFCELTSYRADHNTRKSDCPSCNGAWKP